MSIRPIAPRAGDPPSGGSGDVTGPGSSTDTALALFAGSSGKVIQEGPLLSDMVQFDNFVVVQSESDLPTPVAGLDPDDAGRLLHPCVSDTVYFINGEVSIATGLHLPGNNLVRGNSVEIDQLTYSGTEKMFVVSGTSQINQLEMDCPTGIFHDVRGAGVFFALDNVRIISCLDGGYVDCGFWIARFGGFLNFINDGITHAGTNWVRVVINNWVEVTNGGIGHDFGTTTPSFVSLNTMDVIVGAGATGFSGLANSGNIPVGGLGQFNGVLFSGAGTYLNNISHSDVRWDFFKCRNVQNSSPVGSLSMRNNTTATTITTQGSGVDELGWEPIAGTYTAYPGNELFSSPANGQLQYDGEMPALATILVSVATKRDSGSGGLETEVTVFKDSGSGFDLVDTSVAGLVETDNTARDVTVILEDMVNPGDIYDVRIRNLSSTQDLVGTSVMFNIRTGL